MPQYFCAISFTDVVVQEHLLEMLHEGYCTGQQCTNCSEMFTVCSCHGEAFLLVDSHSQHKHTGVRLMSVTRGQPDILDSVHNEDWEQEKKTVDGRFFNNCVKNRKEPGKESFGWWYNAPLLFLML